ncbi:MAG: VWA domain-containing protein [Deltaproteobacteria bacterium]|nr:VWA domain-containing protein [Deltaproteobacteria bacterium]
MKFAHPLWFFGALSALLVAILLIAGGLALVKSIKKFGDAPRVGELLTSRGSGRRAAKGVMIVLATIFAFVALTRPQHGRGTRLIPATNLDVVIVLDYSKSMYARDVAPSRIARAKAEVARLIRGLPGARFAAVAFAGEPIGFPLTSDGAAIAQFLRQMEPNDMPIGGTAIARALERARELLQSDPRSKDHRRVIVLITDGEDLEGDPVGTAKSIGQGGTTIDVVQIGGRTPERIPEVDGTGRVMGFRNDDNGQPLMTSLTSEGEGQLVSIAQAANGHVVRSERGATGIDVIARELGQMMHSELAEKVETVYADVYQYPLGAALILLLVETFLGQSRARKFVQAQVAQQRPTRTTRRKRRV